MNPPKSPEAATPEPEFVISRVFDAPRELVWKAWTEAERLKDWWGPKGFTAVTCTLDLRVGGIQHYCLRAPNGSEMWGKFVFREIVPPERLVFISAFSDAEGNITRHPLSATWPRETLSTITFADEQGQTKLTIKWSPWNPTEEERQTFAGAMESMNGGWTGTLNQLDEYLANNKA